MSNQGVAEKIGLPTTVLQMITAEVEKKLEGKKTEPTGHVDIVREGSQIILPPKMSYADAITWLTRKQQNEETIIGFDEPIHGFPLDAAYALQKVVAEKYGWAGTPEPGMNWFGELIPKQSLIGLETGPNGETTQVVWGEFSLPNIEGKLYTRILFIDNRPTFVLGGKVKGKHRAELQELAQLTRQRLARESLYRGKAFRISFEGMEPGDEFNFDPRDNAPKFIDVSKVRPEELILPVDTAQLIQDSLFTPIEHTAQCRREGVPLKRGVLMAGPYGVGKTLSAYVAAQKCVQNGWTFVYVEESSQLQQALYFAQQYQPAVVFAEDIDRATSGERTADIDAILNTLDGVSTKNSEILVVLTTNHLDNINRAMLRPGRLDAVVQIPPPDGEAAQRLLRLYARGRIAKDASLTHVSEMLAGQIPAVIREVVERAKLGAIGRVRPGEELSLSDSDLRSAALGMIDQVKLVAPKAKIGKQETVEAFAKGLVENLDVAVKAWKEQGLAQPKNGHAQPRT